jgi:xanthine dehydrogenase small subunit
VKCYKISKRFDQDISSVCGCFNIIIDDGLIKKCIIAFGGMAGIPKRAKHVESCLLNHRWEERVLRSCSDTWQKDFTPLSDLRSSAEYRQTTAHNLLLRYYFETLGANTNVQQVAP